MNEKTASRSPANTSSQQDVGSKFYLRMQEPRITRGRSLSSLYVLAPEVNDSDAVSDYALGGFGWLMNVARSSSWPRFAATSAGGTTSDSPSRWESQLWRLGLPASRILRPW
jgi:hypothetical protein